MTSDETPTLDERLFQATIGTLLEVDDPALDAGERR
jgi:hypothetical protein